MASTSNRWQVVNHLVDQYRGHGDLDGVLVEGAYTGDKTRRPEMVFVEDITGEVSIPTMRAGRKDLDDEWRMIWRVWVVSEKGSLDDAMSRVEQIAAALTDPPTDDPTLGDFEGVIDAVVESFNGPLPLSTPEGWLATATVTIAVHSRLSSDL